MTDAAVDFNLNRLETFLCSDVRLPREVKGMGNFFVLIEGYGRLMDISGAGRDQYTLLFLMKDDFDEVKELVKGYKHFREMSDFENENLPTGPLVRMPGYFEFMTETFLWYVKEIKTYERNI